MKTYYLPVEAATGKIDYEFISHQFETLDAANTSKFNLINGWTYQGFTLNPAALVCIDLTTLPNFRHPSESYWLHEAINMVCRNAALHEEVLTTIPDVRIYLDELVRNRGFNWLTGQHALELIDIYIKDHAKLCPVVTSIRVNLNLTDKITDVDNISLPLSLFTRDKMDWRLVNRFAHLDELYNTIGADSPRDELKATINQINTLEPCVDTYIWISLKEDDNRLAIPSKDPVFFNKVCNDVLNRANEIYPAEIAK
jgi:hypothetical protein